MSKPLAVTAVVLAAVVALLLVVSRNTRKRPPVATQQTVLHHEIFSGTQYEHTPAGNARSDAYRRSYGRQKDRSGAADRSTESAPVSGRSTPPLARRWRDLLTGERKLGDLYGTAELKDVVQGRDDPYFSAVACVLAEDARTRQRFLHSLLSTVPVDAAHPALQSAGVALALDLRLLDAEVRSRLEQLPSLSAGNAVPFYFGAFKHYLEGENSAASQEMIEGAAQPDFNDFSLEFALALQRFARAAGSGEDVINGLFFAVRYPQLTILRQLTEDVEAAVTVLQVEGRHGEAASLAKAGAAMGRHIFQARHAFLVHKLVGLQTAIRFLTLEHTSREQLEDRVALNAVDYKLTRLSQIQADIQDLVREFKNRAPHLTAAQVRTYVAQTLSEGELAALRSLISTAAPPVSP